MAPISSLLAFTLSHITLASSAIVPYLTVETEQAATCRRYADIISYVGFGISRSTFNITCWTNSTMQNENGRTREGQSLVWAWTPLNDSWPPELQGSYPAVGPNGKPHKRGCWVNEEELKLADVYLPNTIEYCGKAPHHQVGFFIGNNTLLNDDWICRSCTELSEEKCRKKVLTDPIHAMSVGCWKEGSPRGGGNTTWLLSAEPSLSNCYLSPDQFDHTKWSGEPAPKCEN